MMEGKEEKRVYVETPMFQGWGEIIYEDPDPNLIFGIQIQLEIPDEDGHYLKRVARYEVKNSPKSEGYPEFENESIRFTAEATVDGFHLRIGKTFVVGPYRKSKTHCFYYDALTNRFLGSAKLSEFKNFESYVLEEETLPLPVLPVQEEIMELFVSNKNGQLAFEF